MICRYELRCFVRSFGRFPTVAQRLEIVKRRRTHKKLRDIFLRGSEEHLGEDLVNAIVDQQDGPISDIDLEDNTALGNPTRSIADSENQILPFPSLVTATDIADMPADRQAAIIELRCTELELRRGHAEDCLELIRGALIQVSWQFKNKVRGAEGAERTRSWDRVNALNKTWQLQRRVYNGNRLIIYQLGNRTELEPKYPELLRSQCNSSTVVEEPNARGQSSHRLPWIWSTERAGNLAQANSDHRNECTLLISSEHIYLPNSLPSSLVACPSPARTLGRRVATRSTRDEMDAEFSHVHGKIMADTTRPSRNGLGSSFPSRSWPPSIRRTPDGNVE